MRIIRKEEQGRRGCVFCTERVSCRSERNEKVRSRCPYDECPYHELDGVKSYGEYLKATQDQSAWLKLLG